MNKGKVVSIEEAFRKLKYLSDRKPTTSAEDSKDSFSVLSEYRDGAIYITHYSGFSEWERHPKGDEIVYLLEGESILVFLEDSKESSNELHAGQLIVVPKNVWHRFESPKGVKVLTITPQPTDHSVSKPELA